MTSETNFEIPAAPQAAARPQTPPQARAPQAPRPPKVDESKLSTSYANFCRVTGTPEELLIDFGLDAQPLGESGEVVAVTERIVLNYFTAKRLLQALGMSVARHEQVFGPLETNVLKRAAKE
ncbi:MAG: DUF3467 domain-containing protein [Pirellulales bacterium]